MNFNVTNTDALSNDEGSMSLMKAIMAANAAGGGKISINVSEICVPLQESHLDCALPPITSPVVIEGNGCTIQGLGIGVGLILSASDCKIDNLRIAGFSCGLWVQPHENKPIKNTQIADCHFDDTSVSGILSGYDQDNTGIDGFYLHKCGFSSRLSNRVPSINVFAMPFVCLFTASLLMTRPRTVQGSYLKNIKVSDCVVEGSEERPYKQGLFFVNSYDIGYACLPPEEYMMLEKGGAADSCIQNITVQNCNLTHVPDAAMLVAGSSCGVSVKNGNIQDILFENNRIDFGMAGIGISGVDQYGMGDSGSSTENIRIRNIQIKNNKLQAQDTPLKELRSGIYVWGALLENGICRQKNVNISNVSIIGNTIKGSAYGISLFAARSYADETYLSYMKDNVLEDIRIEENKFIDNRISITVQGARLDGRWDNHVAVMTHSPVAPNEEQPHALCSENCIVRRVIVNDNDSTGMELFLQATGAEVSGSSRAIQNTVTEITASSNSLDAGTQGFFRKYQIADQLLFENGTGTGNQASVSLDI